jgi:hypothetical protein
VSIRHMKAAVVDDRGPHQQIPFPIPPYFHVAVVPFFLHIGEEINYELPRLDTSDMMGGGCSRIPVRYKSSGFFSLATNLHYTMVFGVDRRWL